MDPVTKDIQAKMEDYSRFIITLLMLSFYFYLGTIISTYVYHEDHGIILAVLTTVSLFVASFFVYRWKQCQQSVNEIQK